MEGQRLRTADIPTTADKEGHTNRQTNSHSDTQADARARAGARPRHNAARHRTTQRMTAQEFFLSIPLATLLGERGASGRLHQRLTREMERTYASCTRIPLLFRSASSLSLALSFGERSTLVCDMRKSRDCLHHSLKEASLWASALAAAFLRLRARAAASEGVGDVLLRQHHGAGRNAGTSSPLLAPSRTLRHAGRVTLGLAIDPRPCIGKGIQLPNKDSEFLGLPPPGSNPPHHVLRGFDSLGSQLGQLVNQLVAEPHVSGDGRAIAA